MAEYRIISADSHFVEPPNMWSSDYPHTAAIWPHSQQFIKETFGGLAEEDRRKIVHDTAARLYGID
jgi:predicted TIM-barrel fold metal-dependent hydrolase